MDRIMDRTDNEEYTHHEAPELHRLHGGGDRELTLGTGTILGIFFALVLVCAGFFGFGYTLGRRSAQPATDASTDSGSSNFNSFKPSPQSVAIQPVPGYLSAKDAAAANSNATTTISAPAPAPAAPTAPIKSAETIAPTVPPAVADAAKTAALVQPAKPVAPVTQPAAPIVAAAPPSANIVQVAAVSHQEDADLLLSSLRKHGYSVIARQDAQDKFIHIQLGPFSNHKDAETMRQKLLADGYNAIIK